MEEVRMRSKKFNLLDMGQNYKAWKIR